MSRKSSLIFIVYSLCRNRQDFLDIQYRHITKHFYELKSSAAANCSALSAALGGRSSLNTAYMSSGKS